MSVVDVESQCHFQGAQHCYHNGFAVVAAAADVVVAVAVNYFGCCFDLLVVL
jgi:hypothetical protein